MDYLSPEDKWEYNSEKRSSDEALSVKHKLEKERIQTKILKIFFFFLQVLSFPQAWLHRERLSKVTSTRPLRKGTRTALDSRCTFIKITDLPLYYLSIFHLIEIDLRTHQRRRKFDSFRKQQDLQSDRQGQYQNQCAV